jgi:L-Ala-D/L-Glu epimerase
MKISWKQYDLQLKHTFRTSRSSSDVTKVVIAEFEYEGIVGYGEASPIKRYQENVETVSAFLQKIDLSRFQSPLLLEDILVYVDSIAYGNASAKCAVDIALHDWVGKKLNVPLHQLWGLNSGKNPKSSFTIAIDTKEVIEQKVKEAEELPILKVKLGTENDKEIIETIRKITDKKLYVDANEGWKDKHLALERIKWLKEQNVEFVEQPMPASQLDDLKWLRAKSDLPLIADESVHRSEDIPKLVEAFDGINIKLMKCTGLREAMRMIHTAKALNMKVMMGCMIETAVGISAAAQLAPLLDYADLDGNVLISNDPFDGVRNVRGELKLLNRPGIGAKKI